MLPGQVYRQLHLAERGRGTFPGACTHRDETQCRRRGDVLRREGTGHHLRTPHRDSRTGLPPAHRTTGHEPLRHHHRPQRAGRGHRHGGTRCLRTRLHPRHGMDQKASARRTRQRRCEQPLLLLPRQQLHPRSHARRLPLPCHRQGHGLRHCQPQRQGGLQRHPQG